MIKKFSISQALAESFTLTIDNAFLLLVTINLTEIAVYLGIALLAIGFIIANSYMIIPFCMIVLFLKSMFDIGFIKMSLEIVDTRISILSTLFSRSNYAIIFLIAELFFSLIVMIGLCMLIIPGIYVAIRFQFFGQYIADEECNIKESLSKSWNLTAGSAGNLCMVYIIFICMKLLIVGLAKAINPFLAIMLLFLIPYETVVMSFIYRQLQQCNPSIESSPASL